MNTSGNNGRTNNRISFSQHDARMRGFRLSHARIESIDSKYALKAFYTRLLPMSRVKLPKYLMN